MNLASVVQGSTTPTDINGETQLFKSFQYLTACGKQKTELGHCVRRPLRHSGCYGIQHHLQKAWFLGKTVTWEDSPKAGVYSSDETQRRLGVI